MLSTELAPVYQYLLLILYECFPTFHKLFLFFFFFYKSTSQHQLGQNEVLLLRGLDDGEREDESYGEDAEEQREDALRYIVDLLGKSLPVAGVRGDKELRTPEPGENRGCGPSFVALQSMVEGRVGRLLLLGDGVGCGSAGGSRRLDVGVRKHPTTVGLQKMA